MADLDPNAPPPGAPPADPGAQPAPQAQPAAAPPRPRNPVSSLQLPETALLAKKEKWQRKAREALLEELGIKDVEAFKQQRSTAAPPHAPAAQAEVDPAAQPAQGQDVEALRSQLAAAEAEREKYRKKAKKAKIRAQRNEVEVLARDAAADHIDPGMYEYAAGALRRHVAALPERDQVAFSQDQARKFFSDLAKKQPAFARKAGSAPPPAAGVRRPLTTGPSPARAAPAPPKATPVAPPAKPARITNDSPNAEVDAAFARMGVKYSPPGRAGGAAPRPNGSSR